MSSAWSSLAGRFQAHSVWPLTAVRLGLFSPSSHSNHENDYLCISPGFGFCVWVPSVCRRPRRHRPGAKAEKLAGDFKFTEGPTCDAAGNVFYTDQPNDRIMKWSTDGKLTTFLQPAGRANGMCFDSKGHLLACADEKNELWSIAPDGKATVLLKDYQRQAPERSPMMSGCGLTAGCISPIRSTNGPWWQHDKMPQDGQHVYYLAPDRQKLGRVADDLKQPNGIIGTPDGKKLFVADIGARKTYSYDIQPDGALANKKLFCELKPDGMTLDNEGNVYLTGKGVIVFDQTGRQIEHIAVDEPWTANVSFGGTRQANLVHHGQ